MNLSSKDYKTFTKALKKINDTAGSVMEQYITEYGLDDVDALVRYGYGVSSVYGNASASLAAIMYDEIASLEGKILPAAELADNPEFGEVAQAIQGTLKRSVNTKEVSGAVSRLVKRTGQDTLIKNGMRDRAEFAWVPIGDTCPLCKTIASRGWQTISKKSLKKGHAEHIHSNCDCSYMIRHDSSFNVAGYKPEKYLEEYENAEGKSSKDKINSMRRMQYAERKDVINAQKRAAYAARKEKQIKQSGGRITGGHHYPVDEKLVGELKQKNIDAIKAYEKFAREDDSEIIAKNSGLSVDEAQRIRSHIFFEKHDLASGYKRFDPDYEMAVAWKRIKEGNPLPRDITLLKHELLESDIEKRYNVSAQEAHERAQKVFNWDKQLNDETKSKGEKSGLL